MQTFTQNSDNQTVRVRVGEPFEIQLPENPSTGFRWHVVSVGTLSVVNDSFMAGSTRIGSAGIRKIQLVANTDDDSIITLTHKRAWEPHAIDEFNLHVNIERTS